MNEIVTPLYLALACIFVGLTVAGLPTRNSLLLPSERSTIWGGVGGSTAALGCLCIALTPLLGRFMLLLSTFLLWVSFQATILRVRSWHTSIEFRLSTMSFAGVVVAMLLTLLFVAIEMSTVWRVLFQWSVSEVLLGWMYVEIIRVMRKGPSTQLRMMLLSTLGIMLVLSLWSWVVISAPYNVELIRFSALLSEASLGFAMRLFLVAFLVLLLVSSNGYALEKMVTLRHEARAQRDEAESLNTQLQEILQQKSDLLQVMAFSSRSQNLPVIMSSLSHEINQPLGAMRMTAEHLLAEDEVLPPEERKQMLRNLALGSMQATQVVRDFRRFFEISTAPSVRVDLSALLEDLDRGLQADFLHRQVKWRWSCPASVQIQGDPLQLETLLTGILHFMLSRTSVPIRHLELACELSLRKVIIRIHDDGPAVTQDVLDAALMRAHPESGSRFTQGLWLSRAIAEHHGGTLHASVNSTQAGLTVHLPLEDK